MESKNTTQNKTIDVKYLVNVILRHWLIILIGVLFAFSVAIVYLKLASRTYLASTRILLNIEERRNTGDGGEYFNVSELLYQHRSLQNELVFFQSTPLIKEVVDEMNIETSYYMQEGRIPIPREFVFTLTDIYKQSPFIVVMDEGHVQPLNTMIYIGIRDDSTFSIGGYNESAVIYDFKEERPIASGANFTLNGIFRFGQTVENEFASFKILLNSNYNPEQYLGKELFFKFNSNSNLADQFRRNLFVQTNERESAIVDLSFQWSNSEIATDFLKNLVNKYIEKNLRDKNRLANSTIEYIDEQLSNISGSLGRSEQQLQNFRSSFDVMSIDEKTRNLTTQINETQRTRDNIETTYQNLVQIKEYFEQNKDASLFVAPSLLGIEDDVLTTLIQEMAQLTREKQDLINRNQVKSPRLKTLDQNISNIKRVITENINLIISSTAAELQEIDNRLAQLDREYSRLPQTQRRLTGLEREFNITDAAYTALLDKRIEAQIAMASNRPDCEIIEPVRYNGVISPNPLNVFAFAIMLGLLFPLLFIMAKVFLTDKIGNLEEIRSFNNLKEIGSLPHSIEKHNNTIVELPNSPISEAFHSVRSNLDYYLMGERKKIILITSSIPNEGKSFTALNIASSFATTHNKTVLVNFDMRKSSQNYSDMKNLSHTGISSYLINRSTIDDIIFKDTGIQNFHYIDNGEIPPDPISLISSQKTAGLFIELKKMYDYVIIDSPPYDVFTDAFLLMSFADIKLFLTRIGVVTRKALKNCLFDLNSKKIQQVYLVINDLKHLNDSKYSYYRERNKKRGSFYKIFKRRSSI